MAYRTVLPENDHDDDCQLTSFTNKLPYYVRHLCKSTNKNKHATVTSKPSEYLGEKSQILVDDINNNTITNE